jgi:hypothetical protein
LRLISKKNLKTINYIKEKNKWILHNLKFGLDNGNRIDIVSLVQNSQINTLSTDFQGKLVDKIKNAFNDSEQKLLLGSFIGFLEHDTEKDFIIDLDTIWKWLGFSRKSDSKRVLTKNFKSCIDYKITLAEDAVVVDNLIHKNEKVLMTIDTFKKLYFIE